MVSWWVPVEHGFTAGYKGLVVIGLAFHPYRQVSTPSNIPGGLEVFFYERKFYFAFEKNFTGDKRFIA